MITNKRQYKITKAALRRLEDGLSQRRNQPESDPILQKAMKDALEGDIDDLHAQLREYEDVISGRIHEQTVDFADLGAALIQARNALGLTQEQLAELVGVKPQQIQRYEATEYSTAKFSRLKEIIWALDINVKVNVPMRAQTRHDIAASRRLHLVQEPEAR